MALNTNNITLVIFFIVPAEPFLDKTPLTINSIEGRQVVLPCVVKNLGYASVSIWQQIIYFIMYVIKSYENVLRFYYDKRTIIVGPLTI